MILPPFAVLCPNLLPTNLRPVSRTYPTQFESPITCSFSHTDETLIVMLKYHPIDTQVLDAIAFCQLYISTAVFLKIKFAHPLSLASVRQLFLRILLAQRRNATKNRVKCHSFPFHRFNINIRTGPEPIFLLQIKSSQCDASVHNLL